MFYTYGRPTLLSKIITTRSYNNWNAKHTETLEYKIKKNNAKLKGCFIPNIYLGNGSMLKMKNDWKCIDATVKKLITACFIDYITVRDNITANVKEPKCANIASDIDKLVFSKIENSGANTQYRVFFKKTYKIIIENIRTLVFENYSNGKFSEKITKLFQNSYIYKKRKTKSKYDWMENATIDEIAEKIMATGDKNIPNAIISALKHRKISVKAVMNKMTELYNNMNNTDKKMFDTRKEKHDWFMGLDEGMKNEVCWYIENLQNKKHDYRTAMAVLLKYNAPASIFMNNKAYWGPTIGLYYKTVYQENKNKSK